MKNPDFSKLDHGSTSFDIEIVGAAAAKLQPTGRVQSKEKLESLRGPDGIVRIPDGSGNLHEIEMDTVPDGGGVLLRGRIDPNSELAKALKEQMLQSNPKARALLLQAEKDIEARRQKIVDTDK